MNEQLNAIEKLAKQVVSPRRVGCQILDCVNELRKLLDKESPKKDMGYLERYN